MRRGLAVSIAIGLSEETPNGLTRKAAIAGGGGDRSRVNVELPARISIDRRFSFEKYQGIGRFCSCTHAGSGDCEVGTSGSAQTRGGRRRNIQVAPQRPRVCRISQSLSGTGNGKYGSSLGSP